MPTPSIQGIRYLLAQKHTQADIARISGVSRQRIHQIIKEHGHESLITEVSENLPWQVDRKYLTNTVYKAMRLHGHWQLDHDALNPGSIIKLRAFLRKLRNFNQVVDYNPSYEAVPGLTNTRGFSYLQRRPEDENYIIRIRPGVRLTPVGKIIWQMPDEIP